MILLLSQIRFGGIRRDAIHRVFSKGKRIPFPEARRDKSRLYNPQTLFVATLLHILHADSRASPQLTQFNLYHPDTYALVSIVTIGEILSIAQQNHWGASKMR
jgi:hypothetical protein